MTLIRTPAVAGQFYSGNAAELSATVATLLDEAQDKDTPAPKALIVPHAGYIYSGPVAASAYARLRPYRDQYQRVVLLGPCHRTPVRGIALCSADAYRMPMGDVPLDKSAIGRLNIPGVELFDESHRYEHSLEVHLPFLQTVLGEFEVVPIVVGDAAPELVSEVLDALWGGPETLIVVSSDLSHYLPYEDARAVDAVTCRAIEDLDAGWINHDMACGATPVRGLLIAAKRHGLVVTTLDLRNSGDTAGDRDNVVGYGAWMFV
ncbi:MAG: AmmeMemoRadiSam system protein B [Gammaproteobacteria bacterium]|nr:AmmeMemoRadiSam system protein B [Gammaproteobacteria bacterium]